MSLFDILSFMLNALQDFKFQFELYIANMSGAQKRKLASEKKRKKRRTDENKKSKS